MSELNKSSASLETAVLFDETEEKPIALSSLRSLLEKRKHAAMGCQEKLAGCSARLKLRT